MSRPSSRSRAENDSSRGARGARSACGRCGGRGTSERSSTGGSGTSSVGAALSGAGASGGSSGRSGQRADGGIVDFLARARPAARQRGLNRRIGRLRRGRAAAPVDPAGPVAPIERSGRRSEGSGERPVAVGVGRGGVRRLDAGAGIASVPCRSEIGREICARDHRGDARESPLPPPFKMRELGVSSGNRVRHRNGVELYLHNGACSILALAGSAPEIEWPGHCFIWARSRNAPDHPSVFGLCDVVTAVCALSPPSPRVGGRRRGRPRGVLAGAPWAKGEILQMKGDIWRYRLCGTSKPTPLPRGTIRENELDALYTLTINSTPSLKQLGVERLLPWNSGLTDFRRSTRDVDGCYWVGGCVGHSELVDATMFGRQADPCRCCPPDSRRPVVDPSSIPYAYVP